jgi:hypothetical protein
MCSKLNCLPRAGGLLDQDAYHVYMLQCVYSAEGELQEKKDAERRQSSGTGH